ncbi:gamma-glutamylcyclotransferase family protein [Neotamlana laminarinivorans]|uniref:Gamma-glutamylcyclotransferase n=1 Tax=Neotamlana laminarinivorans TaxID=2883124 RepID=A0A9X1L261_9FLAO|nr:gamma-glutamylcyclotransferase family protein [Tamlana laminarinivorans]MCB4797324.1 gamma-glutamylcyclotransferase [Tamlana laminarinivorans]
MKTSYLFVYGTLLDQLENNMSVFLRANSKIIGKGYFYGKVYKISWYPGAILSNLNTDKVYGTLVQLNTPENALPILDDYEGFVPNNPNNSLFLRKQIGVYLNDIVYKAWVYIYNKPVNEENRIFSGNFLKQ